MNKAGLFDKSICKFINKNEHIVDYNFLVEYVTVV